jgi:hypothetical protein
VPHALLSVGMTSSLKGILSLMQKTQKINISWVDKLSPYFVMVYAVIFLISGLMSLQNYGLTWDEGLGNAFYGERYLFYLRTFDPVYLNFSEEIYTDRIFDIDLSLSPYRDRAQEFPSLADILSAGTMYLFSYKLKWMDAVDGFHSFKIILSSLFLIALYWFVDHRYGKTTAWISVIFFSLFPRFWADMHFNPKDIPETIFFSLTIMAFYIWYENRLSITKWKSIFQAIIIGLLFGCALSVKANGIFIPFILLLSIIPWTRNMQAWSSWIKQNVSCLPYYFVMFVSGLVMYVGSWPYLYSDPIHQLGKYWEYIFSQGGRQSNTWINFDPIFQAITTMPEIMLLFFVLGCLFICIKKRKNFDFLSRLLIVWAIFPIFRASLPEMVNFDGIRHFQEYVPAAAIIAAYGVVQLSNWLASQNIKFKKWVVGIAMVAFGLNIALITINYQSFSYLYYNSIVGGLSGGDEKYKEIEATDYWASSYRQGMNWINGYAESGAELVTPIAPWIVEITAPIWLRSDIQLKTYPTMDTLKVESGLQPTYIMFITRKGFYDSLCNYCLIQLEPVYQIAVDGVPILVIYRIE